MKNYEMLWAIKLVTLIKFVFGRSRSHEKFVDVHSCKQQQQRQQQTNLNNVNSNNKSDFISPSDLWHASEESESLNANKANLYRK